MDEPSSSYMHTTCTSDAEPVLRQPIDHTIDPCVFQERCVWKSGGPADDRMLLCNPYKNGDGSVRDGHRALGARWESQDFVFVKQNFLYSVSLPLRCYQYFTRTFLKAGLLFCLQVFIHSFLKLLMNQRPLAIRVSAMPTELLENLRFNPKLGKIVNISLKFHRLKFFEQIVPSWNTTINFGLLN